MDAKGKPFVGNESSPTLMSKIHNAKGTIMKTIKNKKALRRDTVNSDTIHVGIELELTIPCDETEHDDDACREAWDDYVRDLSIAELIERATGVSMTSRDARALEDYLNVDAMVEAVQDEYDCDHDCDHFSNDDHEVRRNLEQTIYDRVGNTSIKVVEDSSIRTQAGRTDAEVCWNYYISKDTIKDNKRIMDVLQSVEADFDKSCGLHINLNNYLEISRDFNLSEEALENLFHFVCSSRRGNSYCSRMGLSGDQKYSMIYNQGDRLEFRFFSPTLDAEKLNNYVTLAHTIYKQLAGINAKLPKKVEAYFRNKMLNVNARTEQQIDDAINCVHSLHKYSRERTEVSEQIDLNSVTQYAMGHVYLTRESMAAQEMTQATL